MEFLIALGAVAFITGLLLWLDHRSWQDRDPDIDAKCAAIDDTLGEAELIRPDRSRVHSH